MSIVVSDSVASCTYLYVYCTSVSGAAEGPTDVIDDTVELLRKEIGQYMHKTTEREIIETGSIRECLVDGVFSDKVESFAHALIILCI